MRGRGAFGLAGAGLAGVALAGLLAGLGLGCARLGIGVAPLDLPALDAPPRAPLQILLTNDDGWNAPGIQALYVALIKAGHAVTLVAPATQQSGKGGSLRTGIGESFEVLRRGPGVWSVDGTPTDAVRAALGAVLPGLEKPPPDLVVSGCNFGQNLAMTGSHASGTVGAALQALYSGFPAVACSVGIDLAEARAEPRFASTVAAFEPAAAFIARLVDQLSATAEPGEPLLPPRTALNVNVPVPWERVQGVAWGPLGHEASFAFVWRDAEGSVARGGGPVRLELAPITGPDPVDGSDANLFAEGYITITAIDGDVTAPPDVAPALGERLGELRP